MKNKLLEEILIALSLSNLLFIKSWRRLIYPTSEAYHIKLEPYSLDYLGILICVLLLAGFFFGGLQLWRYFNKGKTPLIVKLIFLAVFGIVLNGIRLQFYESESSLIFKIGLFAVIGLIGILILLKWRNYVFPFTRSFVLILSTFVLFTFSQTIMEVFTTNPQIEPNISAQLSNIQPKEKPAIKNRIVWIVYDELDYYVPFGMSPPIIDLPEFNKLKNESLFANNAVSPSYETIESLPSLITGKQVDKSVPNGKSEMVLRFKDNSTANFSESPNIFRKIKELNGDTAVVGWYHSYCRVIGKDLSACQWESLDTINDFAPQPLSRIIINDFTNCLISLPFGFRLFQIVDGYLRETVENEGYIKRHHRMSEGANAIVGNPNIDLALIHLPFPHPPNYYNRATGQFGSETSYLDNLVLADKTLGELRKTMENKGLWDNSTVIVSSDHQWRLNSYKNWLPKEDFEITQGVEHPNIPFLVKFNNQKKSIIYETPFNTVITHDLILAIMKGEISTAEEIKNWLDAHSQIK